MKKIESPTITESLISRPYLISMLLHYLTISQPFFSSFDLYKSYYQIEVASKYVYKTAIIMPLGNYGFKRVPAGIKCASNAF